MIDDNLVAQVNILVDLVNYQSGAIVSRTIIEREKGSITVFAFYENQGLSEHTTPYDAVVQSIEGEAIVTISGNPLQLKQGDIVILPANKPHAVKALTKFKMILTMIKS